MVSAASAATPLAPSADGNASAPSGAARHGSPAKAADPPRDSLSKVARREAGALERRHWVRLTRTCNNRCVFCHDAASQNGTFEPTAALRDRILRGREEGATRLVLSGGEPTLHPDFLDIVAFGRATGYARIQVVTNGRMFAYAGFTKRALDAGLGEVTFSLHGHTAALHDELVDVPGAFAQATDGLANVMGDGRAVVSVDVVLCRRNVPHLREIVEHFLGLGVAEIDLLQVVPFGRAFGAGRDVVLTDPAETIPHLHRALALARAPGVQIWTNRIRPEHLEGHEELIQPPHKLLDEIRGREEDFEALLAGGRPLRCREPERCSRCHVEPFCDSLLETQGDLARGRVAVLRHDSRRAGRAPRSAVPDADVLWLRAPTWNDVDTSLLARLPTARVWVEVSDGSELRDTIGGRPVRRLLVSRPEDLAAAVATGVPEVTVRLDARAAPLLATTPPVPSLVLWFSGRETLDETIELDADMRDLPFRQDALGAPVEGVPPCIAGPRALPAPRPLDLSALRPDGTLDLLGFAESFLADGFRVKSLRCRACVHDAACNGLPIHYVRAFGFRSMKPVR